MPWPLPATLPSIAALALDPILKFHYAKLWEYSWMWASHGTPGWDMTSPQEFKIRLYSFLNVSNVNLWKDVKGWKTIAENHFLTMNLRELQKLRTEELVLRALKTLWSSNQTLRSWWKDLLDWRRQHHVALWSNERTKSIRYQCWSAQIMFALIIVKASNKFLQQTIGRSFYHSHRINANTRDIRLW